MFALRMRAEVKFDSHVTRAHGDSSAEFLASSFGCADRKFLSLTSSSLSTINHITHLAAHRPSWIPPRSPSSSSKSPASSDAPVRLSRGERIQLITPRLPWWCHPGPRRVHGRHNPQHHPKRQGARYVCLRSRGVKTDIRQSAKTTFCACWSLSARPDACGKRS